jgi:hypothetical protein
MREPVKTHLPTICSTAHGLLGGTLACGSALVTVALSSGNKPDVAVEPFLPNRV